MPKVTAPRIWWDEASGAYACATPYNEQFVMYLKLISSQDKKWEASEKLWYFSPQIVEGVRKEVERIYGSCHFIGRATPPPRAAVGSSDVTAAFARLVGLDAMAKAYREAVARHHPDRGGDASKMAEINALWAQVKEVLK